MKSTTFQSEILGKLLLQYFKSLLLFVLSNKLKD